MSKNNYYAVWAGHNPGVYDSWAACLAQVRGYKGAIYKGFATRQEAEEAIAGNYADYVGKAKRAPKPRVVTTEGIIANSIAVDAACSGNPGKMEYRGVYTATGQELFHFGPIKGTNNIGEFLAIVHALALMKQKGWDLPIYSDSRNALLWVKGKKCKTKLAHTKATAQAHDMIARAERWLAGNEYTNRIIKWETDKWGEIPADFGRK